MNNSINLYFSCDISAQRKYLNLHHNPDNAFIWPNFTKNKNTFLFRIFNYICTALGRRCDNVTGLSYLVFPGRCYFRDIYTSKGIQWKHEWTILVCVNIMCTSLRVIYNECSSKGIVKKETRSDLFDVYLNVKGREVYQLLKKKLAQKGQKSYWLRTINLPHSCLSETLQGNGLLSVPRQLITDQMLSGFLWVPQANPHNIWLKSYKRTCIQGVVCLFVCLGHNVFLSATFGYDMLIMPLLSNNI